LMTRIACVLTGCEVIKDRIHAWLAGQRRGFASSALDAVIDRLFASCERGNREPHDES
jgi:hypothetical protein